MTEQSPYAALLADLEKERDGLNTTIAVLRRKMGLAAEQEASGPKPSSTATVANGDAKPKEITSDTFFGMKVPDAIRAYLAMVKRPAKVSAIADALTDGGLQHTAKDFNSNVQTALHRMKGEVVKVPNGWGLAEWYPGRNFPTKPKKAVESKSDTSTPT
jgi:hypothetical protein